MVKLIILMTIESFFLVLSQIFLKFGLNKISKLEISISFCFDLIRNYFMWLAVVSMVFAAGIWFWVLKRYDFSIAYPLVSISYILGLFSAIFIFNENVPILRWVGVSVIILGIILITKS